jgi:sec-independent protein translocase protein TatC
MANAPESGLTPETDEGGPVKSFLDHLEDLRWVLIKSGSAVFITMLLCLIAGDKVVGIIKRPLEKAQARYQHDDHVAVLMFENNKLGTYLLDTNEQNALHLASNQFAALYVELQPGTNSTNVNINLRLDTSPAAEKLARQVNVELSTLSPAGGFFVAFQVAFYGGLGLASPLVFYFIAQFVFPALKMKERHYVYRGLAYSVPLFLVGVSFCYFILMPVALSASQLYSRWLGLSANIWRAEDYISFVCKFMLGMGLGFELPVVILVLVKLGILNYTILSKARRYMIVINLVLGALLTTPEVLTQVLMAVPLQLLFEISVWIAWYWERQDRKRAAAEEAGTAS